MYFRTELLLLFERAGFHDVEVVCAYHDAAPTADDDFLVYVGRA